MRLALLGKSGDHVASGFKKPYIAPDWTHRSLKYCTGELYARNVALAKREMNIKQRFQAFDDYAARWPNRGAQEFQALVYRITNEYNADDPVPHGEWVIWDFITTDCRGQWRIELRYPDAQPPIDEHKDYEFNMCPYPFGTAFRKQKPRKLFDGHFTSEEVESMSAIQYERRCALYDLPTEDPNHHAHKLPLGAHFDQVVNRLRLHFDHVTDYGNAEWCQIYTHVIDNGGYDNFFPQDGQFPDWPPVVAINTAPFLHFASIYDPCKIVPGLMAHYDDARPRRATEDYDSFAKMIITHDSIPWSSATQYATLYNKFAITVDESFWSSTAPAPTVTRADIELRELAELLLEVQGGDVGILNDVEMAETTDAPGHDLPTTMQAEAPLQGASFQGIWDGRQNLADDTAHNSWRAAASSWEQT